MPPFRALLSLSLHAAARGALSLSTSVDALGDVEISSALGPADARAREARLDAQLQRFKVFSCDFVVYYDAWIPTFDGEYNSGANGAECLEACCRDPTCKGLALESTENSQCYKYSKTPVLGTNKGHRLADGQWLLHQREAWSIFMKATVVGQPLLDKGDPGQLEADPDRIFQMASPQQREILKKDSDMCQWTVYYDMWAPSFDQGEYEHPGLLGGAHCLEACCLDDTCQGLALESTELYQCYKYSKQPPGLSHSAGKPLKDGQWLRHKSSAWSVFVKSKGLPLNAIPDALAQPLGVQPLATQQRQDVVDQSSPGLRQQSMLLVAEPLQQGIIWNTSHGQNGSNATSEPIAGYLNFAPYVTHLAFVLVLASFLSLVYTSCSTARQTFGKLGLCGRVPELQALVVKVKTQELVYT